MRRWVSSKLSLTRAFCGSRIRPIFDSKEKTMAQATLNTPITDEDLDTLENFIFSDAVSEDSLDLIGIHALLCAISISPVSIDKKEWFEIIFDGEPNCSAEEKSRILNILERWKNNIQDDLYSDRELEMPCELTLESESKDEESELELWAQAFMEGVFLNEEAWFNHAKEDTIAELMLPIMVASNLFEDPEFTEIRRNKRLAYQMVNEIPDLLIDLYLVFHAPDK
jgi:uncharacterized protein